MWRVVCLLAVLGWAWAQTYRVKPGDTLYGIAQLYGTTVEVLQALNGISNPSRIAVGQELRLPASLAPVEPIRMASLPAPLAYVELPLEVVQGQTFRIRWGWQTLPGPSVEIRFLEVSRPTLGQEMLWAVPALQPPGRYELQLVVGQVTVRQWIKVREVDLGKQALTLPPDRLELLQQDRVKQETARLVEICQNQSVTSLSPEIWKRPLASDRITTIFGIRRSYNGGPYRSYHEGLDYGAPAGMPVYAPAAGKVALAEALFVRGNSVVINHGLGVCSGYWHLSRSVVKPGQQVNAGTLLGYVGSTGLSTGPHLHFEVRVHGVPTNPMPWYSKRP